MSLEQCPKCRQFAESSNMVPMAPKDQSPEEWHCCRSCWTTLTVMQPVRPASPKPGNPYCDAYGCQATEYYAEGEPDMGKRVDIILSFVVEGDDWEERLIPIATRQNWYLKSNIDRGGTVIAVTLEGSLLVDDQARDAPPRLECICTTASAHCAGCCNCPRCLREGTERRIFSGKPEES